MHNRTAIVVDDHPLVAKGIADFMRASCGIAQVNTAQTSQAFWLMMKKFPSTNLVVVDFWLPDGASLALIAKFKLDYPDIPILITSADDNPLVRDKARKAGANGFIHKQESPEAFAKAVCTLLNKENWFTPSHDNDLSETSSKELPITAQELGLTERQGEVLVMILNGLPNKRIAQALSVSEQTVKEHVSGILERLGARNRIEVITKLRGKKLLKPYE